MRLVHFLLVAITGVLTCCNQPARAPDAPRAARNVYDLSLTLDLRDSTGAQEYYTVDQDGVFGFGGGMNARFERIAYTTQLTDADMQLLRQCIESQRLLDGSLASSNEPKDVYYRFKLKFGDDHVHKNLKGANERLEALRVVLRDFANRRLEPELDRQPKPSAATQSAEMTTQPK